VSIAFLFPGQGSQKAGMGQALAAAFPESRAVFEEADRALGFALSDLCFQGPDEDLQLTSNTQPAILATSIAAYRALASRGVRPQWVAGHSLGEYSALVAAGTLTLTDAVAVVRRRGQYMQEAVPVGEGAMAAILMLDLPAIEQACREAASGQVVAPANMNGPGQVVIAGHKAAVERAMEKCKAAGAKRAVALPVSAPFHCSLMKPAQDRLEPELRRIEFRDPVVPLMNNVDAAVREDWRGMPRRTHPAGLVAGTLAAGRRAAGERGRRHVRGGRPGRGPGRAGEEDREGSADAERARPRVTGGDADGPRLEAGGLMPLVGKVSLVTGASRGIGRAIATALAADGAAVALAARDEAKLAEVVREIEAKGGKAMPLVMNVADAASVEAGVARVVETLGRIDHLVNNAGITRDNLLLRMKPEEWQDVITTNLSSVYLCTQAVLRPMLKQKSGGRIVNVTSVVGLVGNAGQANYAASKAGVIGFTKSIAREIASRGITVNAVAPGFIETDMTHAMTEKAREGMIGAIPLGRVGRPEDIAGVVAFLVSESAAYITGQGPRRRRRLPHVE